MSRKRRGRLHVSVSGRDTSGEYSGRFSADSGRVVIDSWEGIDGVPDHIQDDAPDTAPAATTVPAFDSTRDYILDELADKGSLTRRAFRNRVGYQEAIDGLIEDGRVVEDIGEKGRRTIRLAEDAPLAA